MPTSDCIEDGRLKISVVTVCFNSAITIERALKSVSTQSWPMVEHIVIDGGSTDGTLDKLAHYSDRLACMISEPDRGIYDAMNKGLAHATGDIVCFLNADDMYANNQILETVALEMQARQLDALFGDVAFFRADVPDKIIRRYRSRSFRPSRIPFGWMPAHPALFIRRHIYKKFKGFRTNYRIAGDFEFIARAFYFGNLNYSHMSEVLVMMQAGGVSTSGLRSKWLLNKEVLQACKENGIPTNLVKILSKYPAKVLELFLR